MIRLLLAASLLLIPAVARAQSLVAAGQITWGLAATFPPFEFVEDGKPVGFDLDLANALAKQLSLRSSVTTFEFGHESVWQNG